MRVEELAAGMRPAGHLDQPHVAGREAKAAAYRPAAACGK
jgi:hypothetical protein